MTVVAWGSEIRGNSRFLEIIARRTSTRDTFRILGWRQVSHRNGHASGFADHHPTNFPNDESERHGGAFEDTHLIANAGDSVHFHACNRASVLVRDLNVDFAHPFAYLRFTRAKTT